MEKAKQLIPAFEFTIHDADAAQNHTKLLFSQRQMIAQAAVEWLEGRGIDITPVNLITALDALGRIRK